MLLSVYCMLAPFAAILTLAATPRIMAWAVAKAMQPIVSRKLYKAKPESTSLLSVVWAIKQNPQSPSHVVPGFAARPSSGVCTCDARDIHLMLRLQISDSIRTRSSNENRRKQRSPSSSVLKSYRSTENLVLPCLAVRPLNLDGYIRIYGEITTRDLEKAKFALHNQLHISDSRFSPVLLRHQKLFISVWYFEIFGHISNS